MNFPLKDKEAFKDEQKDIALIRQDIEFIKEKVSDIKTRLDADYLTRIEFDAKFGPIQKIVMALVLAVMSGWVGLIFYIYRVKG